MSALTETPTVLRPLGLGYKSMNLLFREKNKVLEVEDQLLCPDMQHEAGIDHNKLKNSFEIFQRKLRQVVLEAKNK